jgi:hypothetical protein
MQNFVIHITDPRGIDERVMVQSLGDGEVGRAAQLAIDDVLARHGGDFAFPLFIDIHPAEHFAQVAAHYEAARERGAGVN